MKSDPKMKPIHHILSSSKMTHMEAKNDVRVRRAATSLWQSAEWGVRSILASFSRMQDCLEHG